MSNQRRFEGVAHHIAQRIREGEYPAGTRLPGERELAKIYNVSRVTIRQALVHLQALGEIQVKAGSGAHVLTNDLSKASLPVVTALELTEARAIIESECAALAAQSIGDADLAKLALLVEEMSKENPDDPAAHEGADREFHLTIAQATRNSAMYFTVMKLWQMRTELPEVKRVYDDVCQDSASLRGEEHQEILDALLGRDPQSARRAMKKHFTRLLESMLDFTERTALDEIRKQVDESRERFLTSAYI